MISKHVPYEAAHDNYGALARYIADAGHEGEKCLASWCAGCVVEDDYELAIVEAQAAQALNTRSQKEKTYHLLISFRPEDEAKLTPEAFKAIEERFPKPVKLGPRTTVWRAEDIAALVASFDNSEERKGAE